MTLHHVLLVSFTLFTFTYCLSIKNEDVKIISKTIGVVVSNVCSPFTNITTYSRSQKLLCIFCKGIIPSCWTSARPSTNTPVPTTTTSTTISKSTSPLRTTTVQITEETTSKEE
ncbi:uncharacterized protein LOC113231583 [Hyposmocoma kahamanoa]|uniref:uncharacterized protein LOC113231583 n=1 Tax=Hyposmocoma kahamanoa TaxID=1477025 RepID=UPI000E6D9523|nr:uncharacterized protein LOC113231583 [Hyposmocoma kahamanoa]